MRITVIFYTILSLQCFGQGSNNNKSTSNIPSGNIIYNGDFSLGNKGFTSQYYYTANNTTEGECYVGTNPANWYYLHFPCTDHTLADGRMLLVNGSPEKNTEIWKTDVIVTPGSTYEFSLWICSISKPNPAELSLSINGENVGELIKAGLQVCKWTKYTTKWKAGKNKIAQLVLLNKNTVEYGNDFALDDITMSPFSTNTTAPCSNWLKLSSFPSSAKIGDLDINGSQLTIEALINRTTNWGDDRFLAGDIVSKHSNTFDINYLLRPNSAQITTTNGYFQTPPVCNIKTNATYHVAMVYNGEKLKFYRNGELLSEVAATGNLITNNWNTCIGLYDYAGGNTNFIGYINEIKIWKIARTQAEIKKFMRSALPIPESQKDLLAYYTFDNLKNKKRNSLWDIRLYGKAEINKVNPNCNFNKEDCTKNLPCLTNKPSAAFNHTITNCLYVQFNLKQKPNDIKSIKWFFGDGSNSNLNTPAHLYKKPGFYKVKVIITNKAGCTDTVTNEIKLQTLNTDFVFSEYGQPGQILFKAKSNKASYSWNFADGIIVNNETTVNHTFTLTNTYKVSMYAKNSQGCTDTVSKYVNINLPALITDSITNPLTTPVITEAIAPTTILLEKREKDVLENIIVTNDSLLVSVYDNGIVDGDSVTLIFNDKIIAEHKLLSSKPYTFAIVLDKNLPANELMMYAENLGSIPPNTSLIVINDGPVKHQLNISSSKKTNGTISFTLKNKNNSR